MKQTEVFFSLLSWLPLHWGAPLWATMQGLTTSSCCLLTQSPRICTGIPCWSITQHSLLETQFRTNNSIRLSGPSHMPVWDTGRHCIPVCPAMNWVVQVVKAPETGGVSFYSEKRARLYSKRSEDGGDKREPKQPCSSLIPPLGFPNILPLSKAGKVDD